MRLDMTRPQFLRALASTALATLLPRSALADAAVRRCRPSDPAWPPKSQWAALDKATSGKLFRISSPLEAARDDEFWEGLKNPYYIGEQPGLTQSFGWLDAWTTKPSVYGVAARNAHDIAAAVNFARDRNLRLVVKGGGHSYLGTSNAPDSLLIWTRHMTEVTVHDAFVPRGCKLPPQAAVTVGAGVLDIQAYDAVTTRGGRYVQGGGCMTVGLAGLVLGGGFGSYSKHYGLAAASLLEAEIVTADGQIRIANACTNADLFWALKGGGGGTFGVVSKMTLKTHDLPDFFGAANFTVKASSDADLKRLLAEFVRFYRTHLFNEHWGEQVSIRPDNTFGVHMNYWNLTTDAAKRVWQPFMDWLARMPDAYSITDRVVIGSVPARHWWDVAWWKENWPQIAFPNPNGNPFVAALDYVLDLVIPNPALEFDKRPGASPNNAWWSGNTDETGIYWWAYDSTWLPASLLHDEAHLAEGLFAASRAFGFSLHFNKGLAGAPAHAIEAARDTAVNPALLSAFALVISADGEDKTYPGLPVHEPHAAKGRQIKARIAQCMKHLRMLAPDAGSYFNETNYFTKDWQRSFWGSNYERLAQIKRKYDPGDLFIVHNGVGSERWSPDGFTRK